ncbi:hypothetical protein FSP39_000944 [Pinctada imbricata]|uniref:Uncharacterized protein n=1 Tax=Pinctada imbricata TaxID=66713 RepID=A0AA89BY59_PINIB|nr:hypothetical protein FSP39_000944 [Pinctada imbricata]
MLNFPMVDLKPGDMACIYSTLLFVTHLAESFEGMDRVKGRREEEGTEEGGKGQKRGSWSQTHLELLGVHADLNSPSDPLYLIKNYKFKFIGFGGRYGVYEEKMLDSILISVTRINIIKLMEGISLDYERLEELSTNDVKILGQEIKMWKEDIVKHLKTEEEKDIVWTIALNAHRFVTQLAYMVRDFRYGRNRPLEGMYQQLLQEFIGIFGIKLFAKPGIRSSCIGIKEQVVSSTADMVILPSNGIFPTDKVLVVCKVKGEVDEQSQMRTDGNDRQKACQQCGRKACQRSGQKARQQRAGQHVSGSLIGQHGGDLLSYLPQSTFADQGIFGMIVQETKVSFTVLDPEEGFLLQLNRDKIGPKTAELHISEELNILSKTGRKNLIRPLMEFLCMQNLMHEMSKNVFNCCYNYYAVGERCEGVSAATKFTTLEAEETSVLTTMSMPQRTSNELTSVLFLLSQDQSTSKTE